MRPALELRLAALVTSTVTVAMAALLFAVAARAEAPHQHGVVQVDAALEGGALTVALSVPLDSLLGYERAPRTAAEKQTAAAVAERFKRGDEIVLPDPAAQCERIDAVLVSAALGLGPPAKPAGTGAAPAGEEHADIDATYSYRCREPGKLAFVDLPVMKSFPRVARIEAQIVAARGQAKQVLQRPTQRIVWPR